MEACQLCFILLSLTSVSYCQQESTFDQQENTYGRKRNIIQLAEELGVTSLIKYVKDAGLEQALSGPGPFTVFAPTNDAFDAMPEEVKADPELLRSVLKFHMTHGRIHSSQLFQDLRLDSLNWPLKIRINICYPDNNKFMTVDGSKVVLMEKSATNGIIHVIDKVMFPFPVGDIPTEISKHAELSALSTAITAGNVTSDFAGTGGYTFFAPTNAAFAKLPAGTLARLMANTTALQVVLKYHMVVTTAYSCALYDGPYPTMAITKVFFNVTSDAVTINGLAKVIKTDLSATNGVIHEIDTVLIPHGIDL